MHALPWIEFVLLKGSAVTRIITAAILCWSVDCRAMPEPSVIQHELDTIYQTTTPQMSLNHREGEILNRVQSIMLRQAGYLVSQMHPSVGMSGAGSITAGNSNEHSIRPNARVINGLAIMARALPDDAFPTTLTRQMCRDNAVAMLKFVLPTHDAGKVKCADGKYWKNQWQSALWASSAGMGGWLLWDELTPEMRWLTARMVTDEANRFIDKVPPAQVENDTKAEENAWNSTVISLAACMFPKHPNHAAWKKAAATWAVSSFVREADLASTRTIDGATLSGRGLGATLHDDYTMENHHRVHPDYMNTINMCLEQWALYSWAGLPQPEALEFNTDKVYSTLLALAFPDGGYLYVNGQDWQLHRNPQWFTTHMLQAIFFDNSKAAFLARRCLETCELMVARTADGGVFLPEEFRFASAQADTLEQYCETYLALAAFGEGAKPVTEAEYLSASSGVHHYVSGKFVVMRTPTSVSTFSWGDQPMGMVLPLQKDLLFAPNERSMIGTIAAANIKHDRPQVTKAATHSEHGHFWVCGELIRAEGAAGQKFAFIALKDGRSVYVDEVRILKSLSKGQIGLGTVSILNDKQWVYHDGTRDLFFENGKIKSDVNDERAGESAEFSSRWVNIENRMGVVVATSDGRQLFHENKKQGNGRLEQLLHLNTLDFSNSTIDPSTPPLRTALVFLPGQSHNETALFATRITASWSEEIQGSTAGSSCVLRLEDGTEIEVDFGSSSAQIREPTPTGMAGVPGRLRN